MHTLWGFRRRQRPMDQSTISSDDNSDFEIIDRESHYSSEDVISLNDDESIHSAEHSMVCASRTTTFSECDDESSMYIPSWTWSGACEREMALDRLVTGEEIAAASVGRKEAINYDLAGREPGNAFKDLRSAAKARKRKRTNLDKHFSYKEVKPGSLGKLCYNAPHRSWGFVGELLEDYPVVPITKTLLYREAQYYPRPPTYHRRPRCKDKDPWSRRCQERRDARKHARQPLAADVAETLEDLADTNSEPGPFQHERYGDDSDAYHSEWCMDRAEEDWCFFCGRHWTECRQLEVDGVKITFETQLSSRDGAERCWRVTAEPDLEDGWYWPSRAPAVLPYSKQDWIPEAYFGLYGNKEDFYAFNRACPGSGW